MAPLNKGFTSLAFWLAITIDVTKAMYSDLKLSETKNLAENLSGVNNAGNTLAPIRPTYSKEPNHLSNPEVVEEPFLDEEKNSGVLTILKKPFMLGKQGLRSSTVLDLSVRQTTRDRIIFETGQGSEFSRFSSSLKQLEDLLKLSKQSKNPKESEFFSLMENSLSLIRDSERKKTQTKLGTTSLHEEQGIQSKSVQKSNSYGAQKILSDLSRCLELAGDLSLTRQEAVFIALDYWLRCEEITIENIFNFFDSVKLLKILANHLGETFEKLDYLKFDRSLEQTAQSHTMTWYLHKILLGLKQDQWRKIMYDVIIKTNQEIPGISTTSYRIKSLIMEMKDPEFLTGISNLPNTKAKKVFQDLLKLMNYSDRHDSRLKYFSIQDSVRTYYILSYVLTYASETLREEVLKQGAELNLAQHRLNLLGNLLELSFSSDKFENTIKQSFYQREGHIGEESEALLECFENKSYHSWEGKVMKNLSEEINDLGFSSEEYYKLWFQIRERRDKEKKNATFQLLHKTLEWESYENDLIKTFSDPLNETQESQTKVGHEQGNLKKSSTHDDKALMGIWDNLNFLGHNDQERLRDYLYFMEHRLYGQDDQCQREIALNSPKYREKFLALKKKFLEFADRRIDQSDPDQAWFKLPKNEALLLNVRENLEGSSEDNWGEEGKRFLLI